MFSRILKPFTLLSLLVLVYAAPAPQVPTATIGALKPRVTYAGIAIKAVTLDTPVTGLELDDVGSVGVLEPRGGRTIWFLTDGEIALIEWSPYALKYLNIGNSTNSYKPLTWDYTKLTSTWRVPYEGDIENLAISTSNSADFLACKQSNGSWTLYLQTGNDVPAGVTCAVTKLRNERIFE